MEEVKTGGVHTEEDKAAFKAEPMLTWEGEDADGSKVADLYRLVWRCMHDTNPETRVFLRGPHTRADEPRYSRLSRDATLGDALRGERLIEFPTLHVATAEEAGGFTLVERPAPGVAAASPPA